eukprot:9160065-Alexandrium_andersonii.AAC.1
MKRSGCPDTGSAEGQACFSPSHAAASDCVSARPNLKLPEAAWHVVKLLEVVSKSHFLVFE